MRAIIAVLLLALCSCTKTVYTPVERTSNETDSLQRVVTSLLVQVQQTKEQESNRLLSESKELQQNYEAIHHNEKLVLNDKGDTIIKETIIVTDRTKELTRENNELLEQVKYLQELNAQRQFLMDSISNNHSKIVSEPVIYPVKEKMSVWDKIAALLTTLFIIYTIYLLYRYLSKKAKS